MITLRKHIKHYRFELVVFSALLFFSLLLFWSTFRTNVDGDLLIATKVWSDFSATIPLIRSFSLGNNFPPQYPIFAGPPIKYHFGFFAIVGLLERAGIPLHIALNGLSVVGFLSLLSLIYALAKTVFKKKAVGFISVLLFLFNGSLGFLEYFKNNPPSINIINNIITNTKFSSFGPYDGNIVSAFWSLNIYTNQRHLALAYTCFLLLLLFAYKLPFTNKKISLSKTLLVGLGIGLFPFIHLAVFGMMGITIIILFFLYPSLRKTVFLIAITALIISAPQLIYMGGSQIENNLYNPGYLIDNLTFANFIKYWFLNLGFTTLLAPIGFILAQKSQRKFFIPFLALFVIGNLFQFTPDMPTNHKFFNMFVIGTNFFTAYLLFILWKVKLFGKLVVPILLLLLTLTGIVDFFPIINDTLIPIKDGPNNKAANFIINHTPKDSVFLNAQYLFDPASMAGRKIYMGWPYFSWGAGYDTNKRHPEMNNMLSAQDKQTACMLLMKNNIDYVEIQNPSTLIDVEPNYSLFEDNFIQIFEDPPSNIKIYSSRLSCN